jgi:PilZ domain-containing protein
MTMPSVRVERRVGQRFPYLLPVSLRENATSTEGLGFTQDLSSRGVFFFTDAPLQVGAEIELTLRLPSEITLGESMPVRCRGHILRVVRPAAGRVDSLAQNPAETKIGVAVRFDGYQYLADAADSPSSFARVSALHPHHAEDRPVAQSAARTIPG